MRRVRFAQAFILIATLLGGRLCAAAERPDSPIVLHAARLLKIDTGEIVSPGEVLVEGEQIVAVGSSVPHPPGARVLDLGDTTLLPGLIDAHVHLFLHPGAEDLQTVKESVAARTRSRHWIDDEVLMASETVQSSEKQVAETSTRHS